MNDFRSMKTNAMRAVLISHAADYVDRLAVQVEQRVPASRTFTRDELVELLRGVVQGMRAGG